MRSTSVEGRPAITKGGNVIIVGGTFEVEPHEREEFIASRHALMRASRAETGCVDYAFCADPVEPGRVLLFERWESEDDLAAHFSSMRAGPQPASEVTPKSGSIVFYDASERKRPGS
jgi:quinol monooxygenase YgiN